jgi:2-dehydropantoate 2-reductase
LAFCDSIPATMTSSMEGDLARGKRLELPWLSGAAVNLGEKFGVPTPVNGDIVRHLEPAVMGKNVT